MYLLNSQRRQLIDSAERDENGPKWEARTFFEEIYLREWVVGKMGHLRGLGLKG